MAKGKQAALAAQRRLEATQDHVDRLTEQLADAKMRARLVEGQAARLPAVEAELQKIRSQLESTTSSELEKCRAELADEREGRRQDVEDLREIIDDLCNRLEYLHTGLSREQTRRMARITQSAGGSSGNRETRRALDRYPERKAKHFERVVTVGKLKDASRRVLKPTEPAFERLRQMEVLPDDLEIVGHVIFHVLLQVNGYGPEEFCRRYNAGEPVGDERLVATA